MAASDAKPALRGPSNAARKRSVARLQAVQILYRMEMTDEPPEVVLPDFLASASAGEVDGVALSQADIALLKDIVHGVFHRGEKDIDPMLAAVLPADWPVERLESVMRAILRAAGFEMLAKGDVPARVVINEYVDLTHAFFEGKEPGFVNGALDKLARTLRPEEFGDAAGRRTP
ncbi:MAG: transcription antitermination factor NusB [Alphaproteobacteria bacterium]|nr:transcription antitermination factor NusB [Alphaproteobacteria bacterium]MBU0798369.1 transcription antitermination factor NusB [Alphaproteobacteria bacterium]MBU0887816.1 transcription antitermination factor NusB [Alphaproteobacteria bacterium]MBU1814961.1 transcription antitermination factor NusB [Alphaproteobacteria bacterium]MBU2091388.1 transcription antitermination factor NusB [Alphaproteobacteria bacterium]